MNRKDICLSGIRAEILVFWIPTPGRYDAVLVGDGRPGIWNCWSPYPGLEGRIRDCWSPNPWWEERIRDWTRIIFAIWIVRPDRYGIWTNTWQSIFISGSVVNTDNTRLFYWMCETTKFCLTNVSKAGHRLYCLLIAFRVQGRDKACTNRAFYRKRYFWGDPCLGWISWDSIDVVLS